MRSIPRVVGPVSVAPLAAASVAVAYARPTARRRRAEGRRRDLGQPGVAATPTRTPRTVRALGVTEPWEGSVIEGGVTAIPGAGLPGPTIVAADVPQRDQPPFTG